MIISGMDSVEDACTHDQNVEKVPNHLPAISTDEPLWGESENAERKLRCEKHEKERLYRLPWQSVRQVRLATYHDGIEDDDYSGDDLVCRMLYHFLCVSVPPWVPNTVLALLSLVRPLTCAAIRVLGIRYGDV